MMMLMMKALIHNMYDDVLKIDANGSFRIEATC